MAETFKIALFIQDNYDNFYDTAGYIFHIYKEKEYRLDFFRNTPGGSGWGEKLNSLSFDPDSGYHFDIYTATDFDNADPNSSNWQYSNTYTDYQDVNNYVLDNINTHIKIDFYDNGADPGDDPGDDPDDPGDDTTYTLTCYSESSMYNIGTYTSDEPINFYVSGHNIYDYNDNIIFTFTNGFYVRQFYNDWTTDYQTYIDSVNFDLNQLTYEDLILVFHDITISDLTGYTWLGYPYDIHWLGNNFTKQINFISNNQSWMNIRYSNNHPSLFYSDEEYKEITVYDSDSWTDNVYRTINIVGGTDTTNHDFIAWLMANGTLTAPTRPDKTKIGGSSIRLKKIGNATVVKEVLNGVVIYTAE